MLFFFSSRRRHTRCSRDWSSDVCSSDLDLTATQNAQPAILAHSAAVFAVVGPTIDGAAVAAAGHSLGEYSAYIAAGALAPTDAAALVRRRGELMQQAGTERPGTKIGRASWRERV